MKINKDSISLEILKEKVARCKELTMSIGGLSNTIKPYEGINLEAKVTKEFLSISGKYGDLFMLLKHIRKVKFFEEDKMCRIEDDYNSIYIHFKYKEGIKEVA